MFTGKDLHWLSLQNKLGSTTCKTEVDQSSLRANSHHRISQKPILSLFKFDLLHSHSLCIYLNCSLTAAVAAYNTTICFPSAHDYQLLMC